MINNDWYDPPGGLIPHFKTGRELNIMSII